MATVHINTTTEEQSKVYSFIKTLHGEQVSVAYISKYIGLPQSRTRYALEDLIADGYVEKIPVRQFNKNYVRYSYAVRKEFVDGSSDTI